MTMRIAFISSTMWDHPTTTSWPWTSFVTSQTLKKSQRRKKLTWCKVVVKSRICRKNKVNLKIRLQVTGNYRRKSWRKRWFLTNWRSRKCSAKRTRLQPRGIMMKSQAVITQVRANVTIQMVVRRIKNAGSLLMSRYQKVILRCAQLSTHIWVWARATKRKLSSQSNRWRSLKSHKYQAQY